MHAVNTFRTFSVTAAAALALTVLPATTAVAHDGDHPFKSCADAYANGYESISQGDDHYGEHLDRDGDGIGCDEPPADFEPHDNEFLTRDTEQATAGGGQGEKHEAGTKAGLARTGGGADTTTYIAVGIGAALVAALLALVASKVRRNP
ncbi:excalibur calcium-binding domain-containing protein [Streptomyces sp. NPDC101219]|uniref:excalibur calcium-binding domain-containing protein n=1 Tax=Streptomyces sp. NPDC101219 TaxID=3366131 RepID=UPI00382628E0